MRLIEEHVFKCFCTKTNICIFKTISHESVFFSVMSRSKLHLLCTLNILRRLVQQQQQQHRFHSIIPIRTLSKCSAVQNSKMTPEEMEKRRRELMAKNLPKARPIDGVKNVVLVSSAKGGVGKSTIATNLAVGIKLEYPEKDVGLLDADVFGPSLPIMMNLSGEPELDSKNLMVPLQNHGIKCMSMGFLVKDSAPVIWRGLMVMSAIEKLVRGVSWSPLDILIVDMPPGTGDTQLSFAQTVIVNGAVIVTTPQKVAVQDAIKGAQMFRKTNVPILGCVVNMSSFVCPSCGSKTHLGGHRDSQKSLLDTCHVDLLAEIPFQPQVGDAADEGTPIVLSKPDSLHAKELRKLAISVISRLNDQNYETTLRKSS